MPIGKAQAAFNQCEKLGFSVRMLPVPGDPQSRRVCIHRETAVSLDSMKRLGHPRFEEFLEIFEDKQKELSLEEQMDIYIKEDDCPDGFAGAY
jgi:hypothetical protein